LNYLNDAIKCDALPPPRMGLKFSQAVGDRAKGLSHKILI
jgi:hypothetical protein